MFLCSIAPPGARAKSRPATIREANPIEELLTVVMPAHNEGEVLGETVRELIEALDRAAIRFEIVVVDDNSTDDTRAVAAALAAERPSLRVITRQRLPGFGRAIRAGLAEARGEFVVVVMADRSDDPGDVVRYVRKLEEGYDCVFGSRFRAGSRVVDYPPTKLVVNRIVNSLIRLLFWTRFNDITNAFKAYRAEVIDECGPYSSSHFNLTVEMSLAALIRGYHITEIPISWYGRSWGSSSLSLRRMGRRYFSVILKMFFERMLVGDDIMEERLLSRAEASARLRRLEDRVSALEKR